MSELWAVYREQPSPDLRRQLIEQYAPLAKYVVDRLNLNPMGGVSYDDLIGQAILGLIDAIDRYDPARGVKFNTYAYYRIRGAVMDMLREMDWMPRSLRAKSNEIANTIAQLEGKLGRLPTDQEISAAMGLSVSQYDDIAQEVGGQTLLSLDEGIDHYNGDVPVTINDMLADDRANSPEAIVEDEAERAVLIQAIEALPENERLVISLYYHDGLTLKEIGRVLEVTESRACQIHAKAILRLKAAMKAAMSV